MNESKIDDIIERLKNENKNILNDLSIIQKYFQILESYRKLCNNLIENCICDENLDNETEFDCLEISYKTFFNQNLLETNKRVVNKNLSKNTNNNQSNETIGENNEKQYYNEDNDVSEDNTESDNEIEINQTLNETGEPIEPIQELTVGDSFEFSSALMLKKLTDESLPKFLCETQGCNTFFTSLEQFYAHKQTHRLNNSLVSDSFTGEKSLKSNNSLIPDENNEEKTLKNTISVSLYKCDYTGCQYMTKEMPDLLNHKIIHINDIARYVCDWPDCGLRFKDRCHLTGHYRKHTGEKPFSCQWNGCGKSFRLKDHLRKHELIHSGFKKFICDKCGKGFNRRDKYNKHKCVVSPMLTTPYCRRLTPEEMQMYSNTS